MGMQCWARTIIIGCLTFAIAAGCDKGLPATTTGPLSTQLNSANAVAEATVQDFVDAYNEQNLNDMLALAHEDITWLSVEANSTTVMTDGAAALREELSGYFGAEDTPRSNVEILKSHGPFVTTLERAYWTVNGEEKSQASFAVYEVENNKIRRVWYYPASP
ncbi:MAG: nuclear transport factor 2 family protein [Pseudomonadota bacterium]